MERERQQHWAKERPDNDIGCNKEEYKKLLMLCKIFTPIKTVNKNGSSYYWKHVCERILGFYVSNNDFKQAMFELGFYSESYDMEQNYIINNNIHFNISSHSRKTLEEISKRY